LKEWLEPERARLEALRSLQTAAATWDRHDRALAFLDHRDKRLSTAGALGHDEAYRKRLGNLEFDYLAACSAAGRAAKRRTRRVQALIGVLVVGLVAGLAAWWKEPWLKERYHWFTSVRGHVLTAEQERALRTGETFKECVSVSKRCPEMVVVPAGEFMMGSPDGKGADEEHPQHKVTIAKPFAVSRFELTFDQWDACVAYGGCAPVGDSSWGRGTQPVINVSWSDAQHYVAWLSRLTGQRYRLLSEAEWEYAARAETTTVYTSGDDEESLGQHAWYIKNSNSRPHPVGEKKPNAFGLFDMHGNIWEWTEDGWHHGYLGDPPTDGSVWQGRDASRRVLRGGSWISDPDNLRSAFRYWLNPDVRITGIGFRVARTLLPPAP
jgi:formylglycine-generating enzyme required for sulfatase activity